MSDLKKALEKLHSVNLAQNQLDFVNKQLGVKNAKLEKLNKSWLKEYEDVQKLENLSLKSVFRKILGDKEKQLEIERQEYLAAFMKYEQYKKTLEILIFEKEVLDQKVAKADLLESKVEQLLKIRKKEIVTKNKLEGKVILKLEQEIRDLDFNIKESLEAVEVGQNAKSQLQDLAAHVKQAKKWGNWDMVSNNNMADIMKRSSIDKARRLIPRTQHTLDRFRKELYDVYRQEKFELGLNIDGLSNFADIFFDNLISDWIVQRKIQNALSNISSVFDHTKRVIASLEHNMQKIETSIIEKETQIRDIIVKSEN